MAEGDIRHIFLDLSFFMVQRGHIFKDLSYNGKPTGIYYGILKLVQDIRSEYPTSCIHIVRDGNPIAKREIYPAYKLNRDEVSYKPSKDFSLIKNLQKMLVCYKGVYIWYEPNYEADDLIASLALKNPNNSVICSGDNDFLQLMCKGIKISKTIRNKQFEFRTNEYVCDKYGVTPNQLLVFRALQGDKSDNITGVVPTKKARKLLECKSQEELIDQLTEEEAKSFYTNLVIMDLTKFEKEPIHHKPLSVTPDVDLYKVFGLERLVPDDYQ